VSGERVTVDEDAGFVHFRSVEKGHQGLYRCVATNDAGQDEAPFFLAVQGQ